jgi:hypothetical protein
MIDVARGADNVGHVLLGSKFKVQSFKVPASPP